jgi:PKD repeat protein
VVMPVAPMADFDGPATQYQHAQATFTARPQGHVTSWHWVFSDNGQTADQPTVQHAFATPGEFQVTLVVGNDWGQNSITKTIRVDPLAAPTPQVSMTGATQSGAVYTAPAGSFVTFTDASTPPPLTTWLWEFGDSTADARTVERSFSPGTYNVRLTASNPAGTSTVALTLVVS